MNHILLLALAASAQAYWLMSTEGVITTERIDPIVNPGKIAGHVHSVVGGSNFRFNTSTAALRQSECSSIPIPQDKSAYWNPTLHFQWANGSFTSVNGGHVIYYLFSDKPGTTTAFPDDFRMLSGDPLLRTYDAKSYAQQAVTYLCLDFNGVSTKFNSIPARACPSGVRAQINFPSCWDGKNVDSADHKSHVAFLSGGPDSGTCSDPKYPVTIPRIFLEVYFATNDFDKFRSQAKNPSQPFVFSNGDPTGYGYHADFFNGWDKGVLQNAVDKCHCNPYGDAQCCVDQGIFDMNHGKSCRITKSINEQTTGTLPKLPGNNPVQPEGKRATALVDDSNPQFISPVYAYTGDSPTKTGTIVKGGGPVATPTQAPQTPPSKVPNVPSPSPTSKSPSAPSQAPPSKAPSAPSQAPPSKTPGAPSQPPPSKAPSAPSQAPSAPSQDTPNQVPGVPPQTPQTPSTMPSQQSPASDSSPTAAPGPAAPSKGQCRPRTKSKRSNPRARDTESSDGEATTQTQGYARHARLHRRFTNIHMNGAGAFDL